MDRYVSVPRHGFETGEDELFHLLVGSLGDSLGEQHGGSIDEDATRITGVVAENPATFGVRCAAINACLGQCHPVPPKHKTMQASQNDGIVGEAFAQQRQCWITIGPRTLVPTPADDPLPRYDFRRVVDDPIDGLLLSLDSHQVHLDLFAAQLLDVGVRIHQSRKDDGSAHIDDASRVTNVRLGIGSGADKDDAAAGHGNRLGIGVPPGVIVRCILGHCAVFQGFSPGELIDRAFDQYEVGAWRGCVSAPG